MVKHKRHQRTFSIRYIRRRYCNGMRQALRIDHNMALDSRNLFASVVALAFRAVRIFDALRINDAKRRLLVAPKADAGRANLIFLTPALADSILLPLALHSICENTNTPPPISGNRSAAFAIDIHFSVRTARRKIFRRDRFALASSFCAHSPKSAEPFQTARGLHRLGRLFSSRQFTRLFTAWQKDRKQALTYC